MGGGAVGIEFASIYRRFGSEVTILELLTRLVPVEDEAVSAELERSFRKQGITTLTAAKVTSAHIRGDGVDLDARFPTAAPRRFAQITCSSRPAGIRRRRASGSTTSGSGSRRTTSGSTRSTGRT